MHVLITNDDGPPNDATSPYVHYLVEALEKYTDWKVSVALPNTQRSWIGKAHMIGQSLTASYIYPGEVGDKYEGPFFERLPDAPSKEWILLDGTPASCANVGVHHLFKEKGPVDLVISGPNYGRNSTALYIMSSGTVGAAIEGALCGAKSIALSFAYEERKHTPADIREGTRISVKLVEHLYNNWDKEAQLYSINVPISASLSDETRILYTSILENTWGANFEPWTAYEEREASGTPEVLDLEDDVAHHLHGEPRNKSLLQFRWAPDFQAVRDSIAKSSEGNDGLAVDEGNISVTPLRAVFRDLSLRKEIKL